MNAIFKKSYKEKFITDNNGEVESVILPIEKYNQIIELIDDYGLGLAMKQAKNEGFVSREEALRLLEDVKD
jgi:hypothetical protein